MVSDHLIFCSYMIIIIYNAYVLYIFKYNKLYNTHTHKYKIYKLNETSLQRVGDVTIETKTTRGEMRCFAFEPRAVQQCRYIIIPQWSGGGYTPHSCTTHTRIYYRESISIVGIYYNSMLLSGWRRMYLLRELNHRVCIYRYNSRVYILCVRRTHFHTRAAPPVTFTKQKNY